MEMDADALAKAESDNDRLRTLVVKRGELRTSLSPHDRQLLARAIDVMIEGVRKAYVGEEDRPGFAKALQAHALDLEGLREKLIATTGSIFRPWTPASSEASLLRSVLSDITGYQRGDLTPGLRELREMLNVR